MARRAKGDVRKRRLLPCLERGGGVRHLEDGFGRRFPYVRLSVTEACNFRCTYCLPNGYRKSAPHDFLSVDEIARLVRALRSMGVQKVRLTGGEPSVRQDLTEIIAAVADAGVEKIALTTNGWTLARRIEAWAAAGLTHLNVSIDSLDQKTFAAITGHNRLAEVLDGVERATRSGVHTKLNAVLLRNTLGDGFEEFASFIQFRHISVRFIELMRTGDNTAYFQAQHVSGSTLVDWLVARGWSPVARAADAGPAIEYAHPDYHGRLGIIAPYAPGFCDSCNRLRVTARGRLRLCLFGEGGLDLRDLLRNEGQTDALIERVNAALSGKVRGHGLASGQYGDTRQLAEVGG